MKSILRATLVLSSSSLISIVVGLVSAKAWAVLLGPSGLGFMGLLQALLGMAGLIGGMGIGAGLVRHGCNALERKDHVQMNALLRAAWLLFWLLGGMLVLVMALFRTPISVWMLGGPEHGGSVLLMGLALLFNLASGVQTSLLNTYHKVDALARIGAVNSVASTAVSLAMVWLWREQGIAPALIVGSIVGWLISSYVLKRNSNEKTVPVTQSEVWAAAWSLLRFGMPYTASMLIGSGVQFALPAIVLHTLGADNVGFYRAAISVAGVYLGFLLIAMAHDYFPRISAISDQPDQLVRLVNEQQRLVLLLAVPMILGTLALAPSLVPLIYSPSFAPTVDLLEWYLIGDLFKFSSWTMGFVILARSRSSTMFLVELIVGVSTLCISWLGVAWLRLEGLGIGFLGAYVIHYLVTWAILRRGIGLTWTATNRRLMVAALVAALVVRALPALGLAYVRTPIALALAVLSGLVSLYSIWQDVEGIHYVRAWRRGSSA